MANDNNNTTTKLGIDVGQFKRGLQDAQRQIKLANAEFKAAAAGMDKWSDSATGVQAKIKQLETTLDAENKKLELQKQRLADVEKEQGKNSAGAQELRIQIANQEAAIAKTEKSLGYFNNKLSDLNKAETQAKSATGALTGMINDQQSKLDALKQKYQDVVLAQGAGSKEAKALGAQISALSGDLATNKQRLADAESAADKLDKSLTDVGDAADEAGKDAENAANGGFTVLKGVMANLATQAINAALNGFKSMGSALIDLGKQAVAGYAEFEQLTGGVEKLFGDSANIVMDYANNAFKTAGMNANKYMQTVTSFSASLISGLGGDTAAAAQIANTAITDMSDNANTFGTSMQDIQNAYQGFAKGNYTMLDNLKLGYGGTKEEMLRLVHEAGVVDESIQSIDDVSFDQIIESIHIIQENMNIAGTTAREASQTIEGSSLAMQAAWQNLVTGLADSNANLDGLINNFIDSLLTYAGNIMPVIQTAIGGITRLITQLVQELLPQVLAMINAELPSFLNAGAQLLITLITGILSALPGLTTAILTAINSIINTISTSIPDIVNAVVGAVPRVIRALIRQIPNLLNAAITLFTALVGAIPLIIPMFTEALPQLINRLVDILNENIPVVMNAAVTLLNAILDAIPIVITSLLPLLPQIVNSIVNVLITNIPVILNGAIQMLMAIVQAIPVIITSLVTQLPTIINQIITTLTENIPVLLDAAIQFLMAIVDAIPEIVTAIVPVLPDIINAIITVLTENIPVLLEAAFKMFMAIVDAIPGFVVELINGLSVLLTTIIDVFIEPVKNFFSELWENIKLIYSVVGDWFREKFTTAYNNVKNAFSSIGTWFGERWNDIKNVFNSIPTWFKTKFTDAWNKIKAVFEPVGEFFGGIWDTIKEKFTDIGQKIGDAVSDTFKNAVNAVLSTATSIINGFIRAINAAIDVINAIPGVSIGSLSEIPTPQLARGGILKKGQIGLLEGNGAEAVVPLDQNKKWINATARAMNNALNNQGVVNNNGGNVTNNYNFTQNNTSPKALSRLEIYRQTKNQFNLMTGATGG